MTKAKPPEQLQRHHNIYDAVRSKAVLTPQGCWQWTGALIPSGYGNVSYRGRTWLAHRLAYELFLAPVPAGLTLDHLCRNRACINPAHLEPVTNRENSLRRPDVLQPTCPKGHLFTEQNTYAVRTRYGHVDRRCRTCHNEYRRRWRTTSTAPSARD